MHTHRVGDCSPGCNPKPCDVAAMECADWAQPARDDASPAARDVRDMHGTKDGQSEPRHPTECEFELVISHLKRILPGDRQARLGSLLSSLKRKTPNSILHTLESHSHKVQHRAPNCQQCYHSCCLPKHGSGTEHLEALPVLTLECYSPAAVLMPTSSALGFDSLR